MITINFALKVIHIYNRHADLVEQLRLPGMCSCFGWDKVIFLETISVILMLVVVMMFLPICSCFGEHWLLGDGNQIGCVMKQ